MSSLTIAFVTLTACWTISCVTSSSSRIDGNSGVHDKRQENNDLVAFDDSNLANIRWPNLTWISSIDKLNDFVRRDTSNKEGGDTCFRHLIQVVEELARTRHGSIPPDWLLSMIDSTGKIPPGVTRGALLWTGNYNQCISLKNTGHPSFGGRYCNAYWDVHLPNGSQVATLSHGVCVPDSCHSKDIKKYLSTLLSIIKINPRIKNFLNKTLSFHDIYCLPKENERFWSPLAIFTLAIIASCLGIAILCSIIETIAKNPKGHVDKLATTDITEEGEQSSDDICPLVDVQSTSNHPTVCDIISCFSLTSNFKFLISKNPTRSSHRIPGIDAIRVLSMTYIILCHCYLFSMFVTNNLLDVYQDADRLSFSIILNGSFSVDSFFVLSGLLLSYHFMRAHDVGQDNNNLHPRRTVYLILCLYIRRILRVIPLYSIVLLLVWSVSHMVSSGPFWDYGDQPTSEQTLCEANWWYNLLFINNFVKMENQCMAWSWFLANDMQFFVLAPILLLIISRRRRLGLVLSFSLLLVCVVSTWGVSFFNRLTIGFQSILSHPEADVIENYVDLLYTKPYARASPYLVGLLLGLVLSKNRDFNFSATISLILWSVCLSIIGLTVFAPYHATFTDASAAAYNSLSRLAWGLVVALVILLSSSNHHPERKSKWRLISSIMSWHIWTPFARLTYAVYLLHPLLMNFFLKSLPMPILYSVTSMIFLYAGSVLSVFVISVPFYLVFEVPVLRLQRLFVAKSSSP